MSCISDEEINVQSVKMCSGDHQKEADDVYSEENSSTVQADLNTSSTGQAKVKCNKNESEKAPACQESMDVGKTNDTLNKQVESADFVDRKEILCVVCEEQFRDRRLFQRHLPFCSGRVSLDDGGVSQCSDKSCNESDEEMCEDKNKRHLCKTCGKKFLNRNILQRHSLSCNNPLFMHCPNCDKVFSQVKHLKAHFLSHVHQPVETYPCPKCDEEFEHIGQLKTHFLTHLGPVFEEFRRKEVAQAISEQVQDLKCDYLFPDGSTCEKLFSSKWSLQRHMNTHFDRIKRFACKQCPKRYHHKNHLKEHVEIFHSLSPPSFACSDCKKTFTRKRFLSVHKDTCKKQSLNK